MEIEINKYDDHVQIVEDGYKNAFSTYRLNSAMTKDLVREELRCRVLSFRPTKADVFKMFVHPWHYRATYTSPKLFKGMFSPNPNRRKPLDYI